MAQQNRTTLQALIDLYITTNGNKEITGAQLNEVLTNLNDSAFLQLDEIRTALSTAYSPATPSDWNVLPTEVKAALDEAISRVEGLENAGFQTAIQTPYTRTVPSDWDGTPNELQSSTDELAQRMRVFETNNFSQGVAFVSNYGDDLTGERGNIGKPFATIKAAFSACPPSNFTVKVLGGSYTLTALDDPIAVNKTNFVLDLKGCELNATASANGLFFSGCNNGYVLLEGGKITGRVNLGGASTVKMSLIGGEVTGNKIILGKNAYLVNCRVIVGTAVEESAVTSENISSNSERPVISNCYLESDATANFPTTSAIALYNNCFIKGAINVISLSNSSTVYSQFNNCNIIGQGETGFRTVVGNASTTRCNGIFNNCHIESTVGYAIWMGQSTNTCFFNNCNIISEIDCVLIQGSISRGATNRTTFNKCSFYLKNPSTSEIFVEQGYGSDLGKTQLIGTTVFNKAFTTSTPARFEVLGDQLTITDAQIPVLN